MPIVKKYIFPLDIIEQILIQCTLKFERCKLTEMSKYNLGMDRRFREFQEKFSSLKCLSKLAFQVWLSIEYYFYPVSFWECSEQILIALNVLKEICWSLWGKSWTETTVHTDHFWSIPSGRHSWPVEEADKFIFLVTLWEFENVQC